MSDRQFTVSDPRPGDTEPVTMSEEELRQTYGFLIDVIDQEGFRQVVVVTDGTRIEVSEVFESLNQHELPH
jgi:hypothetical protein